MKKLFVGLLTFIGLGFTSFGFCSEVSSLVEFIDYGTITVPGNSYKTLLNLSQNGTNPYATYCIEIDSFEGYSYLLYGYSSSTNSLGVNESFALHKDQVPMIGCIYSNQPYILLHNSYSISATIEYKIFSLSELLTENLPILSSQQCQTTYDLVPSSDLTTCQSNLSSCQTSYSGCMNSFNSHNCQSLFNLIPIESVDSNYCEINNLCPSSSTPCFGSGISNFYIFKDNRYIPVSGTTNIFVNLPEYLDYSYSYSNGGQDLDVDLSYNVDSEYIEGVIDINSYRPSSGDFTDVFVSGLTLILPYVFIALFVLFVWKLIKKIFK